MPTWSVVVPTYDRPDQLARCLGALDALDSPPGGYEVIVVDDGNPRPLHDVVAASSRRVEMRLAAQSNAGPGAARNHGVELARGRFVAMTDDDCAPGPGWLQAFHETITTSPRALLGGRTVWATGADRFAAASELIVMAACDHAEALGQAPLFPSNNLAMARDELLELGGFDERFHAAGEDRDLCDRWHSSGRPLVNCPGAVIEHDHGMDAREYWRVHTSYGRGAFRYHRLRRERGSGRLEADMRRHHEFVRAVVRRSRGRGTGDRATVLALVGLAQVATIVGFGQGLARSRSEAAHG